MNGNRLNDILTRHGVADAHELLESISDGVRIRRAQDPDVHMRGSIHQMKDLVSTPESVQDGFSQLEHL
ncbi:hypothetical protein FJ420_17180 [Mesorhizobium sp. B3-1-3]|uniref:hypothetical protein n=1 Tax=unclassified Mesorhizobium TaxID=325217 RepID=UPI00112ECAC9|nr:MULTISPECIES: hypothetical protein [unclassified Mesorhizobium]TPI64256.1 hypothetical protein FJ424_17980 [Mesorhizobium sp. B3-1-8]TPI70264.1 hypothetical protein FJ420_17180 [Mesorhizobium sp. B3-1-3]